MSNEKNAIHLLIDRIDAKINKLRNAKAMLEDRLSEIAILAQDKNVDISDIVKEINEDV